MKTENKRIHSGFTLVELLCALAILVMIILAIGAGMTAGTRAYSESSFQADSVTLEGILNTAIADVLRFADEVKSTAGPAGGDAWFKNSSGVYVQKVHTVFTNYDYGVQDAFFTVDNAAAGGGGALMLHTLRNDSTRELVNSGAYPDLAVSDFTISYVEPSATERGGYFDISYTIISLSDDTKFRTVSTSVRLMNEDIILSTLDGGGFVITYDANGGICTRTTDTYTGISVTLPDATRAGYKFDGWYTAVRGGRKVGDAGSLFTPTKTLTLYPHWTPDLTITFVTELGNFTDGSQSLKVNYTGGGLTPPTVLNYGENYCTGWYTKGGDRVCGAGEAYYPDHDIYLYARWQGSYSVKFDYNTGSEDDVVTAVYTGTDITLPAFGVREGYTFGGWYSAREGGNGPFSGTYESSMGSPLYAHWTANLLTYDPNGGTMSPAKESDTLETFAGLPNVTRTGYTFKGWKSGGLAMNEAEIREELKRSNVSLTADWEHIQYKATFVECNQDTSDRVITYYIDAGFTVPVSQNTPAGYTVSGWYVERPVGSWTTGATFAPDAEVGANNYGDVAFLKLKSPITYTATFDMAGGNGTVTSKTFTIEDTLTLPSAGTKDGYEFAGWKVTVKDGNWTIGATSAESGKYGDVTFTAQWAAKTYRITYDANGGSLTPAQKEYTIESTNVALANASSVGTKAGYKSFTGTWKVKASSGSWTKDETVSGTVPAGKWGDVTLVANWEGFSIYYDLAGGTLAGIKNPDTFSDNYSLPGSPTRSGYSFTGWYLGEDNISAGWVPGEDNLTLTAHWDPNTVTYNYNGNGTSNTSGNYDDPKWPGDPTWTGYTFGGWYSGTTRYYSSTVKNGMANDNLTLTAKWTANEVTYKYGDGRADTKGTYASPNWPGSISRDGYGFNGWYSGSTKYESESAVKTALGNGNLTLTASWTAYTVTFNANGGSCAVASSEYPIASLPTATRTNYGFKGWFTAATGGTQYTLDSLNNALKTGNVTVVAQWKDTFTVAIVEKKNVTISSIKVNNSDVSNPGSTSSFTAKGGQTVKIVCTFSDSESQYACAVTDENGNPVTVSESSTSSWGRRTYTFTFTMPYSDVELRIGSESSGGGGCVAKGTLITMADGELIRVEDLTVGDMIMTFDHDTGRISAAPLAYIYYDRDTHDVIELKFDNGISMTILDAHGFFDKAECRYTQINVRNVHDYIGHEFYSIASGRYVKLISYECSRDVVDCYSLLSAYDINHVAAGMLCVSDDIEGLYNIFEYDKNLRIIPESKNKDIKTFGLVPYEMFADYCTEEEFKVFNCQYLGISIGKGLTTYESLAERMARFSGNSR